MQRYFKLLTQFKYFAEQNYQHFSLSVLVNYGDFIVIIVNVLTKHSIFTTTPISRPSYAPQALTTSSSTDGLGHSWCLRYCLNYIIFDGNIRGMSDSCMALTVNVESDFFVDVLGQMRVGALAHVHQPVHFGRHVERHLDGGQLAAVEPRLGETIDVLGDRYALSPQRHFHWRIAGRRLARQRGLVTGFQVHRIVPDVQMVGENCTRKGHDKRYYNIVKRHIANKRFRCSIMFIILNILCDYFQQLCYKN